MSEKSFVWKKSLFAINKHSKNPHTHFFGKTRLFGNSADHHTIFSMDQKVIIRGNLPEIQEARKTTTPIRSASLRKTDSQTSVTSKKPVKVQRSNSRNSIVSSRSSLNSSASTNTVKRNPILRTNAANMTNPKVTPPSRSASVKSPLSSVNNKVPLKRVSSVSSSSGSSTRPPRPLGQSFMKPTTSSATKINSTVAPNRTTVRSRI